MADEATMYAIAAGFGVLGSGLKEVGSGIIKALRRKSAEDREAREEAKVENAERDQWGAINKLRDDLASHRQDDAKAFAELSTKVDRTHEDVRETKSDIKTLLRRSTGDVPKGGR